LGESVRGQANLGGAYTQPLDDIDRTILDALQDNGHLSHAELSRMVGLAVSSVNERIRKLVQRGVIAAGTRGCRRVRSVSTCWLSSMC
jgi:Lrp/AsnC family transcriptional regulator, leucine-responsive regulatory protein